MQHKISVLFIVFNRPDKTRKVFEAIRFAQPSKLYIAADAPRYNRPEDQENCSLTRVITERVDWPCDVKRLYQNTNQGCSLGPRAAFDWFFSQEEEGIILEDDCVPHPDFFSFAAAMLDRYRNDQRIISINGSNLGYQLRTGDSYTYSRFMNMWGWATWANRATAVDYKLEEWRRIRHPLLWVYRHLKQDLFDTDINWYRYWKDKFDRTINSEEITWWDWQWVFHQVKNRQLSVVPAHNLITNIGFTPDATHTTVADNPAAHLPVYGLPQPWKHPQNMKFDRNYEELFVKWVWCYHRRLPARFHFKKFISDFLSSTGK